ncbi:hypothetical protein V8E51_017686 [Hyaloscypha variabilis]
MDSLKLFPDGGEMFELQFSVRSIVFPALESFVRFSRQRNFEKALELFSNELEKYLDDAFPITIEYADLLFQQGNYGKLSDFLEERIIARGMSIINEDLKVDEEYQLLKVMKSLANIFTKGALRPALVQARRCRDFLAREHEDSLEHARELPTNVQIYMFEVYLSIMVYAFKTSNWVELSDMDPPWSNATSPGNGVLQWFKTLQDDGYLWEASRVLQVLLPVLPMLPSHDVASLIFIEQNHQREQADQSELGESDRWAHLAMNLSKAQYLLDIIVREYTLPLESRFGRQFLYTRGQNYLNKAYRQALDESSQTDESKETRRPNLKVELEQRDYSLIGKNMHLGAPSLEFPKLVVSEEDYRLRVLNVVRELLHHPPDDIQSTNWQNATDDILKSRARSGDHVGFIRAWEFFATIVLSSLGQPEYDKPAKPLLASVRDTYQLQMMDTSQLWGTTAGKAIQSSLVEFLSGTTTDICKYEFAEALSYNRTSEEDYPMQFDIPLCLWASMQRKEQLSLNNLLLEGSDPGNDYLTKKIDLDAVKGCLPDFKDLNEMGSKDLAAKISRWSNYYTVDTFDHLPDGPIALGNIIWSPRILHLPLITARHIQSDPIQDIMSEQEDYELASENSVSGNLDVWVKFMESFLGEIRTKDKSRFSETFRFETMVTEEWFPGDEYLSTAIRIASEHDPTIMRLLKQKKDLYVIVGIKTVIGATVGETGSAHRREHLSIALRKRARGKRSTASREDASFEEAPEFVLAFRVQKIGVGVLGRIEQDKEKRDAESESSADDPGDEGETNISDSGNFGTGADMDMPLRSEIPRSALAATAAARGQTKIVKFLVQDIGVDLNVPLKHVRFGSVLAAAAAEGNIEIVKFLVQEGRADVNMPLEHGIFGSALAAAYYKTDIVKFLV